MVTTLDNDWVICSQMAFTFFGFIGTKTFVLNSAKSNLFLVLAQTRTSDRLGDLNDSMTVFLVDSSSPGVSVHRKDETIGHRTVYQSTVSFDDVRLTEGKRKSSLYANKTIHFIQSILCPDCSQIMYCQFLEPVITSRRELC